MLTIEQSGEDCIVTIYGTIRTIKCCNALKLANTMFDKPVPAEWKYTEQEMTDFGFAKR